MLQLPAACRPTTTRPRESMALPASPLSDRLRYGCPHADPTCTYHPQQLASTNEELVAANPEDAKVFKFVVHCMLQQRTGAAIQSATCQYWDKATDRALTRPSCPISILLLWIIASPPPLATLLQLLASDRLTHCRATQVT